MQLKNITSVAFMQGDQTKLREYKETHLCNIYNPHTEIGFHGSSTSSVSCIGNKVAAGFFSEGGTKGCDTILASHQ